MTTPTTIIGLTGPAGAGKDTVADWLCSQYGFARLAHADPIKEQLEPVLQSRGIDYKYLYEAELKNVVIAELGVSTRELMQRTGDLFRSIDPRWFVKSLWHRAGFPHAPVHDRIVVTDVRYPNEADAVERWGGVLVGVSRPKAMAVRAHSSEQHIGTLWVRCREIIKNEGSVQYLHSIVDDFCHRMGIDRRPCGDLWDELNA